LFDRLVFIPAPSQEGRGICFSGLSISIDKTFEYQETYGFATRASAISAIKDLNEIERNSQSFFKERSFAAQQYPAARPSTNWNQFSKLHLDVRFRTASLRGVR
jgi:hypothetical protein